MSTDRAVSVAVLGSTGSIGVSTLSVISRHPGRFKVFALAANSDVDAMVSQCKAFQPRYAVLADESAAEKLKVRLASAAPDCVVMGGGNALGFVAEVKGLIKNFQHNNPGIKTVLCGGNAVFFESRLKGTIFVVPGLVLYGLVVISGYNEI